MQCPHCKSTDFRNVKGTLYCAYCRQPVSVAAGIAAEKATPKAPAEIARDLTEFRESVVSLFFHDETSEELKDILGPLDQAILDLQSLTSRG